MHCGGGCGTWGPGRSLCAYGVGLWSPLMQVSWSQSLCCVCCGHGCSMWGCGHGPCAVCVVVAGVAC